MIFATLANHTRFHHLKDSERKLYCIDGVWYCERIFLKCVRCGKGFIPTHHKKRKQVYCSSECSSYEQRKIKDRPSKEQLQELLKTNSYCAVGRMFGVSDNTIRKWLK